MERIEKVINEVKKEEIRPFSTGFKFLDRVIGGFYPGQLTTICGSVDCGKTAFVIKQINDYAVDQQIPTLLVMTYMDELTFLSCMAAYYCSIETSDVNSVIYEEQYKKDVDAYLEKLKKAPLFIVNRDWMKDEQFHEKFEGLITSNGIKIVFVDEINTAYFDPVTYKVPENYYKSLALKLNIPVVAICFMWNDWDGPGIKPSLRDIPFYMVEHEQDTIIGLINYEKYGVTLDSNGHDLHDIIHVEILKKKGRIEKRRFLLPWGDLYLRNNIKKKEKTLEQMKKSSGNSIDTLISNLNLSLAEEEPMPF